MRKASVAIYPSIILFFLSFAKVFARDTPEGGKGFTNPLGAGSSLPCLIKDILTIVANLGAIVAVLFIIYSGFLFVTAQGDSAKITEARKTFLYTIIGTAILLGAWGLSVIIANTVGKVTNTEINTGDSCS